MQHIKKKYDKAKNNEEKNTENVEKYKSKLKKYCTQTNSVRQDTILAARECISREVLKQFIPKEVWRQETYKVHKKDKQGKPVMDTEGKQMTETKFVVHDLAQLMRAIADLIDPVNESAERLREEMAERTKALQVLLMEQSAGIAKEFELD